MMKTDKFIYLFSFVFIVCSLNAKTVQIKTSINTDVNDISIKIEGRKRAIPLKIQNDSVYSFSKTIISYECKELSYKNGGKTRYVWNFDDGTIKEGRKVSHQYMTPKNYNVKLTVMHGTDKKVTDLKVIIKEKPKKLNALPPILSINDPGDPESSFSLQQLVEEVLINGDCDSVDNFEQQVFGDPADTNTKSYGYFKKSPSNTSFPFDEGLILTTGRAFEAGNIVNNDNDHPSFVNNIPGDVDIEQAVGLIESFDATFVKFNFVAISDNINFRFIMASEEYDPNYVCDIGDGFAFLLREQGTTTYTNLAVLPDSTPVNVININDDFFCEQNEEFFEGNLIGDTNYYGRTKVLTASSNVTAGTTYEIKLVVADDLDNIIDGAVFLEAGSLNIGVDLGIDITIANGNAGCSSEPVILDTGITSQTHAWFLDGNVIVGETGSTISVSQTGVYSVEVGNAGSCGTDSIFVEFLPDDDSGFTVTSSCDDPPTIAVTITGLPGGTFSLNPIPTDGASIDPNTGQILNGVSGATYTIEYLTQGPCPSTTVVTVTLTAEDDASFELIPTCDGATAMVTGLPGGIFSFNPMPTDGAIIDSNTGEITNGVSGTTYTVEYLTQGPCPNTSTEMVTTLIGLDTDLTFTPSCFGSTVLVTGELGGVFSFNPIPTDGATIDMSSGEIINGVSGASYTVEYAAGNDCPVLITETVVLLLEGCLDFMIPDGFSPNGDNVNDILELPNADLLYPNFDIEIYNRHGNLVYKGGSSTPRFDGKSNQSRKFSDDILPVGMYFYVFSFNDNSKAPKQGTLYLSR